MTQLTELAKRKVQHLCIFGDPKSGKSELAASCASFFKKVIWISMDNGHEVLFKLPRELQERIEIVVLPDTMEFPVALYTCRELVKGKLVRICDAHGQVACTTCRKVEKDVAWTELDFGSLPVTTLVVFDHVTQLARSAMNFIVLKKPLDFFPGWDEFRYQGMLMDRFFLNIQQAPYNCICIAHVAETELEDGGKKLVPLVGTVPYSRNVGTFFDHLIYCRVSNKKHNFGSSTTYIASALTGSRGDVVIEEQKEGRPTLLPFFEGKMENLSLSAPLLVEEAVVIQKAVTELRNLEKISEAVSVETTFADGSQEILRVVDLPEAEGTTDEGMKHNGSVPVDDSSASAASVSSVSVATEVAPSPSPSPSSLPAAVTAVVTAAVEGEKKLSTAEAAKQRLAALRAARSSGA